MNDLYDSETDGEVEYHLGGSSAGKTCDRCGGTGMITSAMIDGFDAEFECPRCHGSGKLK